MPEYLNKKQIEEITTHVNNAKEFYHNNILVFGSEVRYPIMRCLDMLGPMTKKDLYNILIKKHKLVSISYINISANVDILIKAGLLKIDEKTKQQYNQKTISINEDNFRKYMKKHEKLFGMFFFKNVPSIKL